MTGMLPTAFSCSAQMMMMMMMKRPAPSIRLVLTVRYVPECAPSCSESLFLPPCGTTTPAADDDDDDDDVFALVPPYCFEALACNRISSDVDSPFPAISDVEGNTMQDRLGRVP